VRQHAPRPTNWSICCGPISSHDGPCDRSRRHDPFFQPAGRAGNAPFSSEQGRFTLIYLAAPGQDYEVELTYNWPAEDGSAETYTGGRNFGHLAFQVEDIYATCQTLADAGITINRPPRDGHMAFVKTPDGISVELLQNGHLEPREPWASMANTGSW
jgi:lactoylglutathione lyase